MPIDMQSNRSARNIFHSIQKPARLPVVLELVEALEQQGFCIVGAVADANHSGT